MILFINDSVYCAYETNLKVIMFLCVCLQVKLESHGETVKGVLFANKTDLTARRVISPKMGREAAQRFGLLYFEGSAVRTVRTLYSCNFYSLPKTEFLVILKY